MIKLFEAFAGVGSQAMALRNLGLPFESIGIAEIDKYAIQSYNAIHGETKNYGDISKVDWNDVPDFDLFTYSFPCQDLSMAGKRKGLSRDSGTRSSLLWECERTIKEKKPTYLLLENVKGLITEEMKPYFFEWLGILRNYGYMNYYAVLNAKNYGTPQNRERVFVVSIRNDVNENREVEEYGLFDRLTYKFPIGFDNGIRLKDVLEDKVDEKYYLSDTRVKYLERQGNDSFEDTEFSKTILACYYKTEKNSQYLKIDEIKYKKGGVCGCDMKPKFEQEQRIWSENGIQNNEYLKTAIKTNGNYRIRKLTPKECWRLMAFADDDFNKIDDIISNTQKYRQAGNSICVNVLEFIFYELFKNDYEIKRNPYDYYNGVKND